MRADLAPHIQRLLSRKGVADGVVLVDQEAS